MPVALRPPWVKISQRPVAVAADLLRVDGDDDRLRAEASRGLGDDAAVAHRGGVDRDLVGAGEHQGAHVVDRADAAADGDRHEADLGGAGDDVEHRAAVLVAGGDVEEAELVGAGGVIGAAPTSTGSPASARSTKRTPLTTRPSLTSRQGMTRTFSITI